MYFQCVFKHWWYSDYADSIQDKLRERELERREFRYQSPQLEFREHCVNIIRTISVLECLSRSTVHLGIVLLFILFDCVIYYVVYCVAVYLLDVFMDNHTITTDRLALVSLSTLILAAKVEEHDSNIPKPRNLNTMIDQQYPPFDYIQLERMQFRFFEFQLIIPTAVTFIEYYIEGIADAQDYELAIQKQAGPFNSQLHMKREMAELAFEFVDLILADVRLVQETPSKVAAACLAAARQLCRFCFIWSSRLANLTRYSLMDIDANMNKLLALRAGFVDRQQQLSDSGYLSSGNNCDDGHLTE